MPDKKPTLKLATNVPTIAILTDGKNFSKGSNDYGEWFSYNVRVNGEEFVYFANENAHEQLSAYGKGDSVQMLMTEKRNDNGKPYKTLEIRQAIFEDNGKLAPPGKPNLLVDEAANTNHREGRKMIMLQGLEDALAVAKLYNETMLSTDPFDDAYRLMREDVRAMAISFAIKFEKQSA